MWVISHCRHARDASIWIRRKQCVGLQNDLQLYVNICDLYVCRFRINIGLQIQAEWDFSQTQLKCSPLSPRAL